MKTKPEDTIPVAVRMGNENRARAGFGFKATLASSTSDPKYAALRAAAKYFGCGEHLITLRVKVAGSTCPIVHRIYEATKGGAS